LKKNAAAKLINTRVIKGVASPNRNQGSSTAGKRVKCRSSSLELGGRAGASIFNRSSTDENVENDERGQDP
jgi:hypothetical protein